MEKYPSIPNIEDEEHLIVGGDIIITEKIDGANGRFQFKNGKLYFGTRRTKQTKYGEPLDIDEMNQNFRHVYKYLKETLDFEKLEEFEGATFFGECLHKNHIGYDSWEGNHPDIDSDTPNYLCFDIYTEEDGFLPFDKVQEICSKINLETPRVIWEGTYENLDLENFEIPQSEYRTVNEDAEEEFDEHGLAEGVVIRNKQNNRKVKYVHPKFSEKNKTYNSKSLQSEEVKQAYEFVNKYVTEARIRKIAYKIRDEREEDKLKMEFMEELPLRVIDDVFDEESIEIDRDNEDIMSVIRSRTSDECSGTLAQLIQQD